MRGKRFAEKAGMGAHPRWGPWFYSAGMPFAERQRRPIHQVHPYPAGGARWTRKSRQDCRARQKRSPWTTDRYLCA